MECEIDLRLLRKDLMDYYGTAVAGGFPMAIIDLSEVENASIMELVELAKKNGLDLRKYVI